MTAAGRSDLIRNDKWITVLASEQLPGLLIPDNGLALGVEINRPSGPVGDVAEMAHRGRKVALEDVGGQVVFLTGADRADEILEMRLIAGAADIKRLVFFRGLGIAHAFAGLVLAA